MAVRRAYRLTIDRREADATWHYVSVGPQWNGMSPDPTTSVRFQSTAAAGLTVEQLPRLQRKWAFGFPDGSGVRGQPTVAGGRVFVGSDNGVVYGLDARTGCVHWSFEQPAGMDRLVVVGARLASSRTLARWCCHG